MCRASHVSDDLTGLVQRIVRFARVERALHMRYSGSFYGAGHSHSHLHHLDFVRVGQCRVMIGAKWHEIRAGQAVFVRAGLWHSSREAKLPPVFEIFSVSFYMPALPTFPVVTVVEDGAEWEAVFKRLVEEFSSKRTGRDAALRLYLAQILPQILHLR